MRRDGWGDYAGGSAPGLSFSTAAWLHRTEIAGIATDTWGFEVRPNEFDGAFQPLHQIAIPNLGLFLGEMWDLGRPRGGLRGRRQVRLPAHRGAAAHHRRRRVARQPDRPPVAFSTTAPQPSSVTPSIQRSQRWQQYRTSESSGREPRDLTAAILLADAGIQVEILEKADAPQTLGSGITLQGNALRVLRRWASGSKSRRRATRSARLGLRAPDPAGTVIAVLDDMRTGGDDLPATLGMYRPDLTAILRERAGQAGARISYGKTVTEIADDGGSVTVSTADGGTARYDLLIGADGLHSAVRKAIGIDSEPQPTGMGIWRAFVERPAGRGPHRPDLRRPLLHRRLLPHGP